MSLLFLHQPWEPTHGYRAVMTTRLGGSSEGPFEGLNLGSNSGDDPQRVRRHWEMVAQALGIRLPLLLNQCHSACVVEAAEENHLTEADGWVVHHSGLPVAVQVADCLPVALVGSNAGALVHAGWRGLAAGILEEALARLKPPILAWVGPGIDGWAYEVGPEVRERLLGRLPLANHAFRPLVGDRWLLDLKAAAASFLRARGCTTWVSSLGTWSRPDLWYSWRRGQPTGRQAMILWKT